MGCMSSKSSAVDDSRESPKERIPAKKSSELRVPRLYSSKREEGVLVKEKLNEVKVMLIEKKENGSVGLNDDDNRMKMVKPEFGPGSGRIPKAIEAEQVAAGWPVWLSAAASEAIKGWIPRRAETFQKLEKIGQGTYSCVFKARDLSREKIVALKRVRFDNHDIESIKFMAREILILRRLDHRNIIKLEGLITSPNSCSLYLVFEYMEHDLTGLASRPSIKFSESQVKCYMQQLLSGIDHCHSRGVLHRDIKGSNLLIDNNGILKIADFGLASFFDPCHNVPLTSRVVTLWYRPPELLVGDSHYGVGVDLWSTGCILGELYSTKPILRGRTEVEQLHMIFKLCGSPPEDYWRKLPHSEVFKIKQTYRRCVSETFKDFPATAVGLMETLLSIIPDHRGTADLALKSEFFSTNPLACDPSSLPKYPPSKEIDANLQEEARRQGAAGVSSHRNNYERKGPKEFQAVEAYNANPELSRSMQKTKPTIRSEVFYRNQEEAASGYLIDPLKQSRAVKEVSNDFLEHQRKRISHSGPLVRGSGWAKASKESTDIPMISVRADLSTLSGLVATRTEDRGEKLCPSQPEIVNKSGRIQDSFPSTRKHDGMGQMPKIADSSVMGSGRIRGKESIPNDRGSRGNRIFVSGPLLVPSNNVDQMLKDYDRQFQEFDRRSRLDKARFGKRSYPGDARNRLSKVRT